MALFISDIRKAEEDGGEEVSSIRTPSAKITCILVFYQTSATPDKFLFANELLMEFWGRLRIHSCLVIYMRTSLTRLIVSLRVAILFHRGVRSHKPVSRCDCRCIIDTDIE